METYENALIDLIEDLKGKKRKEKVGWQSLEKMSKNKTLGSSTWRYQRKSNFKRKIMVNKEGTELKTHKVKYGNY